MKYKRILLKLSGEALIENRQYGIDPERLSEYAQDIKEIKFWINYYTEFYRDNNFTKQWKKYLISKKILADKLKFLNSLLSFTNTISLLIRGMSAIDYMNNYLIKHLLLAESY